MKIREIAAAIEEFAPLKLQADYDNSGLVVGRLDDEVHKALLAVDVTEEVLNEAEREGCDIVITHHPIIFTPLKRFNSATYVERCVERAIRSGIALYACHTNLDSTVNGMSWQVGSMIGLSYMSVLEPRRDDPSVGYGVIGTLTRPENIKALLMRIKSIFDVGAIRHSDLPSEDMMVRRIAICTGSGRSLIGNALAADADLYITADLRYNDFMEGENRMVIADIGHFESEFCAIRILDDVLSKKLCNFAVRKSLCSRNPIHYLF
ncbi:MAG: Nif3-like dinuclear metal center hexameric protein [Alistipes sp.]|nr:Nif3-like dinuclear metal center hexameric protein [Alistipes sp.]